MEADEDQRSQSPYEKMENLPESDDATSDSDNEDSNDGEEDDIEEDEEGKDEKEMKDTKDSMPTKEDGSKQKTKSRKRKSGENRANRKRSFERRNIRKIKSDDAIAEATREAIEAEKARRARFQQRPRNEHIIQSLNAPMVGLYDEEVFDGDEKSELLKKRARLETSHLDMKPSDVIIVSEDEDDDSDAEDAKRKMAEKRKTAIAPLSKHSAEEDMDVIDLEDSDNENLNDGGSHVNDALNVPDEYGRVLINVNHPEEDEDLYVASQIGRALKPHQIGGIRFMYDNVIESTARISQRGFGCILAHAMGLGKTIQVICFVDVAIRLAKFKTVLILVPINTIQNWSSEFERWLPAEAEPGSDIVTRQFPLFSITDSMKTFESRAVEVAKWRQRGGVMLIGYEMFRILVQREGSAARRPKPQKRKRKRGAEPEPDFIDVDRQEELAKMWDDTFCALVQPGPDIVIADEGHRIKNEKAEISQKVKNISTSRRVVLTGYPLQNNLEEYHCMVDFVRPNYLGSKMEFNNMFNRPITNGMCVDSTPEDKRLMHMRSHVLFDRLQGFVQRRSHKVLRDQLPEKTEYVIFLKMSLRQRNFYRLYMNSLQVTRVAAWAQNNPLKAFAVSVKIMNHPDILYKACSSQDKESTIDDDFDGSVDSPSSCVGVKKPRIPRIGKSTGGNYVSADFQNIFDKEDPTWSKYSCGELENGPKMMMFFDILIACVQRNEKILAFTQSLSTLDIIEAFLNKLQIPGRAETWSRNNTYYRLDGSTPPSEREKMIKAFNSPEGQASLFLLSTRAGCLGINLTAANRVVVFDASWNPCHDCQAVCRVFRYGQTREVFVYRFIMDNTLERKIYERQVKKQSLSVRVVDETTPDQHFTRQQLEQLMAYEDNDLKNLAPEEIVKVEWKDPILMNILVKNHVSVTEMPFTHESLLIDKREFHLTSKEKREAHQEYESARKDVSLCHGVDLNLAQLPRQSYANFYPANGAFNNPLLDPRRNPNSTLMKLHKSLEMARHEHNSGRRGRPSRFPALAPGPTAGVRPFPPGRRGRGGAHPGGMNGRNSKRNENISVKEVNLPHDLSTPAAEGRPSITIPRGTRVKIIQTEKGTYLNHNNFMFALRSKSKTSASPSPMSIIPTPSPIPGAATAPVSTSSTPSQSPYPVPPWMQHQRPPFPPPMYNPGMPLNPFYPQSWPRGPTPLPSMQSFSPQQPERPFFPPQSESGKPRQTAAPDGLDSLFPPQSEGGKSGQTSSPGSLDSFFPPQSEAGKHGQTSAPDGLDSYFPPQSEAGKPGQTSAPDGLDSYLPPQSEAGKAGHTSDPSGLDSFFPPQSSEDGKPGQSSAAGGLDSFFPPQSEAGKPGQSSVTGGLDSFFPPQSEASNPGQTSRHDSIDSFFTPNISEGLKSHMSAPHNSMESQFYPPSTEALNFGMPHMRNSMNTQFLPPSSSDIRLTTANNSLDSHFFPSSSSIQNTQMNTASNSMDSHFFPPSSSDAPTSQMTSVNSAVDPHLFPPSPDVQHCQMTMRNSAMDSQFFPSSSDIQNSQLSTANPMDTRFFPSSSSDIQNSQITTANSTIDSHLFPSSSNIQNSTSNSGLDPQLYPPSANALNSRSATAHGNLDPSFYNTPEKEAVNSPMYNNDSLPHNSSYNGHPRSSLEELAFSGESSRGFDFSMFNGKMPPSLENASLNGDLSMNDDSEAFPSNTDSQIREPLHI